MTKRHRGNAARAPQRKRGPKPERSTTPWVYGPHVVQAFISARAGEVRRVVVSSRHAECVRAAKEADIVVEEVDSQRIEELVGDGAVHQGIAALVDPREPIDLDTLLARTKKGTSLFVLCDQIQDPRNLGAIARAAYALDADGLLIAERRSAPLSAVAYKASAGALVHLPVCVVGNISRTIDRLKREGIWVYGGADEAKTMSWQADFTSSTALVIGAEGKGLRPLVKESCDALVKIPMRADGFSLNAADAAACLLYEAQRQRALTSASGDA